MEKIKIYRKALLLITLILVVSTVVSFLKKDLEEVLALLRTVLLGDFAEVIFVFIFSIKTILVFFPYYVMVILGGSIFGSFYGFVYSMIGVYISATIAFFMGKALGQEFIKKIIGKKYDKMNEKIKEHGMKVIFIMRISSVFPIDPLNFVAGTTKISYKDFIIGTFFGMIPETFALSFLGANITTFSFSKIMISMLIISILIGIPTVYKKYKKSKRSIAN